MNEPAPLKLRAHDLADLTVLSSLLQDAILRVADMAYLPRERRFLMVANRFRWERPAPVTPPASPVDGDAAFGDTAVPAHERIHTGICFDRVRAVHRRRIDQGDRNRLLSLLAFKPAETHIDLIFADDASIRLELDAIRCHVEDLGLGWPTQWRPAHEAS